ncbi:hypothetical protein BT96DRAFT_781402, partial [Gymnopus androsaceus JB14]
FNKQHEHYKTHTVTWNTAQTQLALNFLGGSLPRSDAGDMEYYSCTMLTLFKPWNTGADLKTPNQSWQDAFNDYNFTKDQKQLMKNLNLRWECYDSRDDY